MIRFLRLDNPGWLRGVTIGRFYIIIVADDYKRFVTIGFNK
jgi:hypothetical protein